MNNIKLLLKSLPQDSFQTNRKDNSVSLVHTSNNLEVLRYHMPKDQTGIFRELDSDDKEEVYYIEEGSIRLSTNNQHVTLNPGDMFVVDSKCLPTPFRIIEKAVFTVTTNYKVYHHDRDDGESLSLILQELQEKDGDTRVHCNRVQLYAMELALHTNLDPKLFDILFCAARFHDVGKIKIPLDIIMKPARLNNDEYEIMKKHSYYGYEIVKDKFGDEMALPVLQHHEWVDGNGYPNHLKGDEICDIAKIISVCDAYDAMRTVRPYNKGKSRQEAIKRLQEAKGTQFDSKYVDVFVELIDKNKEW